MVIAAGGDPAGAVPAALAAGQPHLPLRSGQPRPEYLAAPPADPELPPVLRLAVGQQPPDVAARVCLAPPAVHAVVHLTRDLRAPGDPPPGPRHVLVAVSAVAHHRPGTDDLHQLQARVFHWV